MDRKKKAQTTSQLKKPSLEWLGQRLTDMKRAFPRPELSDFDAESHVKAWVRIGEWAGQERLEAALQRCVAECHFFPKVDEIEERIPAANAVLRGVTDARCH